MLLLLLGWPCVCVGQDTGCSVPLLGHHQPLANTGRTCCLSELLLLCAASTALPPLKLHHLLDGHRVGVQAVQQLAGNSSVCRLQTQISST